MPVPDEVRETNKLINEGNIIKYMCGSFKHSDGHDVTVFLHEAEWVANHGKPISKGTLISHKDGNPLNNDIDNLEVVDENAEHGDLHTHKIFHEDTLDLGFIKIHFPDIYEKLNTQ